MNEQKTYQTVEEYADHVRAEAHALLAALGRHAGPAHPATLRAGALCTEAATIVQAKRMQEERTAPGAYDLAALHVDANKPTNSEDPFEDE